MQEALAVRKLLERAKGYLMRSKLTEEEPSSSFNGKAWIFENRCGRSRRPCCSRANWKSGRKSNEDRLPLRAVCWGCEQARSACCSASCFLISCNSFRSASISASFLGGSAFYHWRIAMGVAGGDCAEAGALEASGNIASNSQSITSVWPVERASR